MSPKAGGVPREARPEPASAGNADGGARERSRSSEERRINEGVWGTDYTGLVIPKHTNLRWWHGSRYQGGTGSYPTDGPRVLHSPSAGRSQGPALHRSTGH